MTFLVIDDVIKDPKSYVAEILRGQFDDIYDESNIFKGIQPRPKDDEFSKFIRTIFPLYEINYNFIRKSPLNQLEPNFIHSDEMMGDLTVILYLNEVHPNEDGTTIYDSSNNPTCRVYAKFNRMLVFDSELLHSRNIFENFGDGDSARLIQILFLRLKK
jgi:hypothetical protein